MWVHFPLQLEAEARRIVMRFVGPRNEAPTCWSSRDMDILQASAGKGGRSAGQCPEPVRQEVASEL